MLYFDPVSPHHSIQSNSFFRQIHTRLVSCCGSCYRGLSNCMRMVRELIIDLSLFSDVDSEVPLYSPPYENELREMEGATANRFEAMLNVRSDSFFSFILPDQVSALSFHPLILLFLSSGCCSSWNSSFLGRKMD